MSSKEYHQKYYQEHKERYKSQVYPRRKETKQRAMRILGCKCARCGFSDVRALQIDHVKGGGNTHRKARGTWGVYDDVVKHNGKGFQLLCANCHSIKTHEMRNRTKT